MAAPGTLSFTVPPLDSTVESISQPQIVGLAGVKGWVQRHKPLLWVGSWFSEPQPSGLLSGREMTRCTLEGLCSAARISPSTQEQVVQFAQDRDLSLERLYDEVDLRDEGFSGRVLERFASAEADAQPNLLHYAAVDYYARGMCGANAIITTNWDTLLESAFRTREFSVRQYSRSVEPPASFAEELPGSRIVDVYHPHGCFELKDAVLSAWLENSLAMPQGLMAKPILFLCYSGYEPSLYHRLLHGKNPQLWCVLRLQDESPAKLRLLSRPNVYVFEGDVCTLLAGLDVLHQDVVRSFARPFAVDVTLSKADDLMEILARLAAMTSPAYAARVVMDLELAGGDDSEREGRMWLAMRAIDNHVRDRCSDPGLPLALMTAESRRFGEQRWLTLLGFLLRYAPPERLQRMMPKLLQKLDSRSLEGPDDPSDPLVEFKRSRRLRVLCYKKFLGVPDPRIDADTYVAGAHQGWVSAHDIALGGEICELAGFHSLRDADDARARAWLDSAATCYFLAGLRQGGDRVQWASRNLHQIRQYALERTLCIPWKEDPWSARI